MRAKAKYNPLDRAMQCFLAWVVIFLICNGFNHFRMPIAAAFVPPAVCNIPATVIAGGVSTAIFFFVFKIISPEQEHTEA